MQLKGNNMTEANKSFIWSAGDCLNDQAILLEYNTLKGVYQIATKQLLHIFSGLMRDHLAPMFRIIRSYF